jgi:hypothetical protein
MSASPESERPATPRADEQPVSVSRLPTAKPKVRVEVPSELQQASSAQSPFLTVDAFGLEPLAQTPATLRERLRRNRRSLSSVLASFLFHGSVLFLLFLLAISWPRETQLGSGVVAEFTDAPLVADPLDQETESVELEMPEPTPALIENVATDVVVEDVTLANAEVPSVVPVDVADPTPAVSNVETPSTAARVAVAGGGLEGRSSESRSALAAKHGGSGASEAAVERGLKWIIEHQSEDGGWRLRFHDGPCNGRCRNEGALASPNAATSLALLSLLGAGYTAHAGPYQEQVASGIEFLLKRMRRTGFGVSFREGDKGMYAHALATMALSEAFAMTRASELPGPIAGAVEYIEKAQHRRGGWRYEPGYPGDMLVPGWQIMALKSAQNAGFQVDPDVLAKADAFVDSLASSRAGQYAYGAEGRRDGELVASAVGMLMKLYQGRHRNSGTLAEGALFLSEYGMIPDDIYYNYYATLVLHHRRGAFWPDWNKVMRDSLVAAQATEGHEAGSWHFDNAAGHGRQGGRLYSTAMAIMTLEVYYRYLPLYGYDPLKEESAVGTARQETTRKESSR